MTLVSRRAYLRMLHDGNRERSKRIIVSSLRLILTVIVTTFFYKGENTFLPPSDLRVAYQLTSTK